MQTIIGCMDWLIIFFLISYFFQDNKDFHYGNFQAEDVQPEPARTVQELEVIIVPEEFFTLCKSPALRKQSKRWWQSTLK